MAEIDESELLNLRRLQGVAAKVMQHPEGAKLLEKAVKMVEPTALTPNLDRDEAINAPIKAALKRVEDLESKLAAEKAENEKNAKLAQLSQLEQEGLKELRRDGWTEEGIEGVKKLMDEKGILDPLDAAAIFEKHHPAPPPATPSGHGAWGFMDNVNEGEKDLKALIDTKGENNPLVDRMAREALNEIRGSRR